MGKANAAKVAAPTPSTALRQGWLLRFDFSLLALMLLPLPLLILDPNWIFSALFRDPWIYFGYYLDLTNHLATFDGTYYGTRLTMILPGAMAHRLLPTVVAHHALHLALFEASVGALYVIVRETVSQRAAYLAALTMGTHFFFRDAVGRDYSDAYGITYFLIATLFLLHATRTRWRWLALAVAGAFAAALVFVNIAFALFVPFLIAFFLVADRNARPVRSMVIDSLHFGMGAVALGMALGFYHCAITGRFWFIAASVRFGAMSVARANSFRDRSLSWVSSAVWLSFPLFSLLAGLIRPIPSRFTSQGGSTRIASFSHWQLRGLVCVYLFMDVALNRVFLQEWYYSSLLLPAAFLSFGSQVAGMVEGLSRRQWRVLAWTVTCVLILPVAVPRCVGAIHGTMETHLLILGVPAALLLASVLSRKPMPSVLRTAALMTLISLAQALAQMTFKMENSSPIFAKISLAGSFTRPPWVPGLKSYAERARTYDHRRGDLLEVVARSVRAVQRICPSGGVEIWFDLADPHGVLFDNIACTYNSFAVDNPDRPDLRGLLRRKPHAQENRVFLVILASDPAALERARLAIVTSGLGFILLEQQTVRSNSIEFTIQFYKLSTAKSTSEKP